MDVGVVVIGEEIGEEIGEAVGFDEWVSSRSRALTRFAYLVTANRHDAEDALQAALTTACAKWSRVSRTEDPEAYVRRMIVNAHISLWRSFRRRETPLGDVNGNVDSPDHAGAVSESDAVWRLCASLPARQRAAVVLRFYEDLSYPQIAAVLGCTESTARAHIHRALHALRQTFDAETDDE